MAKQASDSDKKLMDRVETIEDTVASFQLDNTGWLVGMQAILAVAIVKQSLASPNRQDFLKEFEAWSRSIVDDTNFASTVGDNVAEEYRERARRKLDIFFQGISIDQP